MRYHRLNKSDKNKILFADKIKEKNEKRTRRQIVLQEMGMNPETIKRILTQSNGSGLEFRREQKSKPYIES